MDKREIICRLLLAIIIGGLIGYEREYKNRPAGFRTHILVCVGAAIIAMIQVQLIEDVSLQILKSAKLSGGLKVDIGRMCAQVISGVGFLGAGTIIHEKGSVKGLTTAASIWVVACIGIAVGFGYYFLSMVSALSVYLVLVSLKRVEVNIIEKSKMIKIQIQYKDRGFIKEAEDFFQIKNIKVKNIEFDMEEEGEEKTCLYTILVPQYMEISSIIQGLCTIKSITNVEEN